MKALKKLARKFGKYETPDPTPAVLETGLNAPLPIAEQVRRMVQTELSNAAENHGMETWEESDDFDVPDDVDPYSPHELVDDHGAPPIGAFIEETPIDDTAAPGQPEGEDQAAATADEPASPQAE